MWDAALAAAATASPETPLPDGLPLPVLIDAAFYLAQAKGLATLIYQGGGMQLAPRALGRPFVMPLEPLCRGITTGWARALQGIERAPRLEDFDRLDEALMEAMRGRNPLGSNWPDDGLELFDAIADGEAQVRAKTGQRAEVASLSSLRDRATGAMSEAIREQTGSPELARHLTEGLNGIGWWAVWEHVPLEFDTTRPFEFHFQSGKRAVYVPRRYLIPVLAHAAFAFGLGTWVMSTDGPRLAVQPKWQHGLRVLRADDGYGALDTDAFVEAVAVLVRAKELTRC